MKMSAKDYINSIERTYEQYTDPAVQPDQIPDHFRKNPKKGKIKKQKQRKNALKTMCQERGHFSIDMSHIICNHERFPRNNLLIKDRIITFLVPDKITREGFFPTNMFKWAKNSIEAKNDIIHNTTMHLHFQSIKIWVNIPQNIRSQGNGDGVSDENCDDDDRETDRNGDKTENPIEQQPSYSSILDILTEKEMETPLIKDHLELLKKWQTEDSDENCFGGAANVAKLELGKNHKARKTGLKQQRWSERLNSLKKCYIWTKSENILPFQLTLPHGGAIAGNIEQMMKYRLKWIHKALPGPEKGGCPCYVLIQPIYNSNVPLDLSQISGYIYLSTPAKMFLRRLNDAKKKTNPTIFSKMTLKGGARGDIKVWYPTSPTDPITPLFERPIEEIKNELINSKELPPAHFERLGQLHKLTDPDLKKVFRLVPL